MKQRTGRKLLGVLLALVMVVGLVPGMGLTAYAETPVGFVALNENFNNGLGTWWVNTASPAYHFAADSGYVYADPNNGNDGAWTYCYSPMMDLSKAASATLVFRYKNPTISVEVNGGIFDGCDDISVDYVVNNDSGTRVFTDDDYRTTLHNDWQTQTITLPEGALAANVQIRFGATNWQTAGVFFDDVAVYYTKSIEAASNNVEVSYDAEAHGITVSVTEPSSGATVMYGTTEGTYDKTASPTITNVADSPLTVYYKITADNYVDKTGSATVTVTKASPTVTAPTAKTLAYTGSAQELVNAGSTEDGTLYYAVTTENTAPTDENLYTTSIPTETNAGTYYVWYKAVGDENHNDSEAVFVTVTVNKINSTVTKVPEAKTLTYNGSAQELVTAGEATGGTMYYAVTTENTAPTDENLYTASIPTETDAGTYYVWYKAVGDENHNDSEAVCVTVTVNKANSTVTKVPEDGTLYYAVTTENTAPTDESAYTTSIPTGTDVGTYYVWYKVVGDENHNDSEAVCVTVTVANPAYTLASIDGIANDSDHSWYKGSGKDVTLTAKLEGDFDDSFEHFTGVELDGVALSKEDYSAVKGSTVVTLKASALEKLQTGPHGVTLRFDNGKLDYVVTVKYAQSTVGVVAAKTGDENNAALWLLILALSATGVVLVSKKRRA